MTRRVTFARAVTQVRRTVLWQDEGIGDAVQFPAEGERWEFRAAHWWRQKERTAAMEIEAQTYESPEAMARAIEAVMRRRTERS